MTIYDDFRARHIRPGTVGWVYNLGNLLLLTGALWGGSAGAAAAMSAPLAAASAIIFFISGLFYARANYRAGNGISAFAAFLLAIHLFMSGLVASAVLVVLAHSGAKALGAVPGFTRSLAVRTNIRMLASPEKISGYGPMLTRVPVALESLLASDVFLFAATLAWFAADWCLTYSVTSEVPTANHATVKIKAKK